MRCLSNLIGEQVKIMNQYERMEQVIQTHIKEHNKVEVVAWPGCYPLYYLTKDGGVLCPECINKNISLVTDPDDSQWYIVAGDANYENTSLYCDHCNERIESAYADDDESEDQDDEED
jgi:hypothetical protein